jgi:hypothetical protein
LTGGGKKKEKKKDNQGMEKESPAMPKEEDTSPEESSLGILCVCVLKEGEREELTWETRPMLVCAWE